MASAQPEPLNGEDLEVWRGLLRISLNFPRLVDADMQEAADLSLSDFTVLVQLYSSSDALRVTEISRRVGLSVSRVSRAIASLELEGLVQRVPCSTDGRGAMIVLDVDGAEAVRRALPVQAALAAHLIPSVDFKTSTPGKWLNAIADRIDAENVASTFQPIAADTPGIGVHLREGGDNESCPPDSVKWSDNLTMLRAELGRAGAEALRERDLTGNAFAVLDVLGNAARSTAALARVLALTEAGVTKIINRLSSRGWVSRSSDPADARATTIHLTPEGARIMRQVRVHRSADLDRAFGDRLNEADVADLIRILENLARTAN